VEEHIGWNFTCDAGAIRDGWNDIVIYNESGEDLDLIGVELGLVRKTAG
jgi:hypothetical protein